jgi:histidinol-phosphatase (PHP family)
MILYDQHLHSHFSFDSETDPRDNVLAAVERGLAGLTFTEHFDTHPTEWPACRYDDARYTETIDWLRGEFGDRLFIGKGIEICFQPAKMPAVLDFLEAHTFDLVLLSVHWAEDGPVHDRGYWHRLGVPKAVEGYMQRVLGAAQFAAERRRRGERPFDVLGHLDLVKRYTHRFYGEPLHPEHLGLARPILETCLEAGLVPEINTSSARTAVNEPMPSAAVVDQYAGAGGTMMSLGSDAHRPEHIGLGLEEAANMMLRAGLTHQAVFRGRQVEAVPLDAGIR